MKHTFREESAENCCSNCQIMQFKMELLNAKLDELRAKRKERTNRHVSDISKMTDEDARTNTKMVTPANDVINWETRCKRLEKKIRKLRENALNQKSAFESEIEQNQNEKDELNERLQKVGRKIAALNAALLKNCNEGVELLAVKEDVKKRFEKEFEKQKREVENASRERLIEIKRQNHLKALEIVQFELLLKKAHEENMELCYRFHKVVSSLQTMKFAAAESANFQSRLEEKLGALVKGFRNEANDSKTKMMTCLLNNFEAAVEVILSNEPHLHYLINSSMALAFARSEEIKKKDFRKFTSQIDSKLEKICQKQKEGLANSVWPIINRVERMEQIMRRVGDSINILTMNECVYSISENMQELEGMSGKIKVLHKGIDGLCRKIRSEIEETEELQRLIEERNRLMGACQRIGYVQQELGAKLIRAELKYDQLCRLIYVSSRIAPFSTRNFNVTIRTEPEGSSTILGGLYRGNIQEFVGR